MRFFGFFSSILCAWGWREGSFGGVFRGLLSANGGLFGVIEGLFRVIGAFLGGFGEKGCHVRARSPSLFVFRESSCVVMTLVMSRWS